MDDVLGADGEAGSDLLQATPSAINSSRNKMTMRFIIRPSSGYL
jgi:hypothetical protein